ncbi:MAG: hypothetical protein LBM03_01020 [Erysipelotrichaceae bacterium]|nr:hypothetical protein [Erysipelotrichaceae bacterium]
MQNKRKVIYYGDETKELEVEYPGLGVKRKPIPKNFKYVSKNPFYIFITFIVYQIIARPVVWLIMKFGYAYKIKNRKALKQVKKSGYYIYGNHTATMPDAFQCNLLNKLKKNYVIVGPETVSIKGIKNIVMMLGAIPLGDSLETKMGFLSCLKTRIRSGSSIMIYPEKHIWPYYTKIRPLDVETFRFPVSHDVPCFSLTTTYHKRRFSKRAKLITYVDGPFYPDKNLKPSEAKEKLKNQVYEAMIIRSSQVPQYEYIKYISKNSAD